jgi:hypothetical protein
VRKILLRKTQGESGVLQLLKCLEPKAPSQEIAWIPKKPQTKQKGAGSDGIALR